MWVKCLIYNTSVIESSCKVIERNILKSCHLPNILKEYINCIYTSQVAIIFIALDTIFQLFSNKQEYKITNNAN